MRWACAWLVAVGCFEPPEPPPRYALKLVSAMPPVASVHGSDWITLAYDGNLPRNVIVTIDEQSATIVTADPLQHAVIVQTPKHAPGPVRVTTYDGDTFHELDARTDLLSYAVQPALPDLRSTHYDNLLFPSRPELAATCIRAEDLTITNFGDQLLTITDAHVSGAAFTISIPSCEPLAFLATCVGSLCFDGSAPGDYSATITIDTNGGPTTFNVGTSVLPATSGLDASFGGDGGILIDRLLPWYDGRGIPRPDGNGIATWKGSLAISVDSSGVVTQHDLYTNHNGYLLNTLHAMRASTAGAGIFALLSDVNGNDNRIVYLDDTAAPNGSYIQLSGAYFNGLELQGTRVLAIGPYSVTAYSNGTLDTSFGVNGTSTFSTTNQFFGESAIDSQGRLYLVLDDRIVRLTATGTIDSTFAYNGFPQAIAIDASDRVFVGGTSYVARLSATGSEVATFPSTTAVSNVAVDASGRVYVVSGGVVRRYAGDGTFDGVVGYDTTRSVVCPVTGTCYLLGANPDNYSQAPPPSYYENYVLRLGD